MACAIDVLMENLTVYFNGSFGEKLAGQARSEPQQSRLLENRSALSLVIDKFRIGHTASAVKDEDGVFTDNQAGLFPNFRTSTTQLLSLVADGVVVGSEVFDNRRGDEEVSVGLFTPFGSGEGAPRPSGDCVSFAHSRLLSGAVYVPNNKNQARQGGLTCPYLI